MSYERTPDTTLPPPSATSPTTWNPLKREPRVVKVEGRGVLAIPADKRAFLLLVAMAALAVGGVLSMILLGGTWGFLVGILSVVAAVCGALAGYFLISFALFLTVIGMVAVVAVIVVSLIVKHDTGDIVIDLINIFFCLAGGFCAFMLRGFSLRPC
eukprot:TRINITY_DN72_c1_g1_i1.p2 TRINITY_DN72_c1_g1~~TRINITY_DN72_c1_g1_i1.p2  ORF type:complete len:175 (-),score=67.82 TRINITY_DN72_c1_g1_i1:110-577(-)